MRAPATRRNNEHQHIVRLPPRIRSDFIPCGGAGGTPFFAGRKVQCKFICGFRCYLPVIGFAHHPLGTEGTEVAR